MKKLLLALSLFSMIGLHSTAGPAINNVQNEDEGQNCSICWDTVKGPMHTLSQIEHDNGKKSCGHKFHLICIKMWGQEQLSCPMCQRKLTIDDIPTNSIKDLIDENRMPEIQNYHYKTLDLSNNHIGSLNGLNVSDRSWIDQLLFQFLGGTYLKLDIVKTLDLTSNKITNLDPKIFKNFINLKHLLLSNNQITSLKPNTFTGLTALTDLYLNNNRISDIQINAFSNLPKLKLLYLQLNQIPKEQNDRIRAETPQSCNIIFEY